MFNVLLLVFVLLLNGICDGHTPIPWVARPRILRSPNVNLQQQQSAKSSSLANDITQIDKKEPRHAPPAKCAQYLRSIDHFLRKRDSSIFGSIFGLSKNDNDSFCEEFLKEIRSASLTIVDLECQVATLAQENLELNEIRRQASVLSKENARLTKALSNQRARFKENRIVRRLRHQICKAQKEIDRLKAQIKALDHDQHGNKQRMSFQLRLEAKRNLLGHLKWQLEHKEDIVRGLKADAVQASQAHVESDMAAETSQQEDAAASSDMNDNDNHLTDLLRTKIEMLEAVNAQLQQVCSNLKQDQSRQSHYSLTFAGVNALVTLTITGVQACVKTVLWTVQACVRTVWTVEKCTHVCLESSLPIAATVSIAVLTLVLVFSECPPGIEDCIEELFEFLSDFT